MPFGYSTVQFSSGIVECYVAGNMLGKYSGTPLSEQLHRVWMNG